ncbi:CDP-alcohol phosphatidyltransferase family protein [Actinophytocola oryzae]|uniref:Phosphatidylglycerophosphate synthase n=1 Tax=Actinophytocola oryzae TaxID=502181 RepID=A0A4R7V742_9PSEU|nr:CDP-alcohol phosphatidyltransferase family protein [Actinophytocola oryzae]TDV44744.1 phosphatidylglycerophosphate synthase [Actinophytocola oryzae]
MTAPITRTLVIAAGAMAGLLTLLTLAGSAGLGPPGWLAGTAFAAAGWAVLTEAASRYGLTRFGPADLVTMTRAVLVGVVTAMVVDTSHPRTSLWPLAIVAALALATDAIDGRVARRTDTVSEFGARFDMEVDAFLILVLSAYVATQLGWWVLAIGAMRYLFVAAARLWPWLGAPLPVRLSSKAVAAAQGIVLTVVLLLPTTPAMILTGLALLALIWSFAYDVRWLHRNKATAPAVATATATPETTTRATRRRRILTPVACVLVLFALLAPASLSELTPAAFTRIPVEGLLVAGLVLVLPGRARRVAASLVGVGLALITIMKLFDIGFEEALGRKFHPVYDFSALRPAVEFVQDSLGSFASVAAIVGAVLLVIGLVAVMVLSVLRLTKVAVGRRTFATRGLAALGVVWVAAAVLGQPVAANSAANEVYDDLRQARADIVDPDVFAQQAAVDKYRYTHGDKLLNGLRGKDVILVFIESYGRVAVQGTDIAPGVDKVLDGGTDTLKAAGFDSRSAFMTSATFGGISWLAHSTTQSGLWVDSQPRYDTLIGTDRLTLTGAFARAGWRTVGISPSIVRDWPEAKFFGYQKAYTRDNVGYEGPNFAYAKMPDQYTMSAFYRNEIQPANRKPVMAEIDLVSSHIPWTHLPTMIDWNTVGDGSVFGPMPAQGKTQAEVWPDPMKVRAAYGQSIQYSLDTLIQYMTHYGSKDTVMVFLGDHQPGPSVSGDTKNHDVPISIVAGDPAVLDSVSGWGWQDGLNPGPSAPVWKMDSFRNRFLDTFAAPPSGHPGI